MRSVGLVPALALLTGAAAGTLTAAGGPRLQWLLLPLLACAWSSWRRGWALASVSAIGVTFLCAGVVLADRARDDALHTSLRGVLDRDFGDFHIDTHGPGGRHDPVVTRATVVEDAVVGDGLVSLRAQVSAIRRDEEWHPAGGGVSIGIGGALAAEGAAQWRAGRVVELPVTFRRPARYLNDGVPDFEQDLALDGTTLFGSAKSGLIVDVVQRGSRVQEAAAAVRAYVRRSLQRHVAPHDRVSAAIVTAVLIGDRTGLPNDVRERMQAAGTYHVIAISGGNIAILAGLTLLILLFAGITGRLAALTTIVVLVVYAQLVTAGPSVWRATLMATLYLAARLIDHRTPPWQAMALAAALVVAVRPLDVRDVGFILTFGATAALLEGGSRAAGLMSSSRIAGWLLASVAASLAAEIALLPISAWTFSRVTSAGLVLNLLAVPLMGVVQLAGMITVAFNAIESIGSVAGYAAYLAAAGLVWSARLVDVAPWLTVRVPPPPLVLVAAYYGCLLAALTGTRITKIGGIIGVATCAIAIATGSASRPLFAAAGPATLRLTVFDVGQGDATLVRFSDGSTLLVDAGGIPFGTGAFDIGSRVLAPALWARGVRSLDAFLLTHGDPDHIGGAPSVIADFDPPAVWEGVPVPRHMRLQDLLAAARKNGARIEQRRAGDQFWNGGARVRVLHPSAPDWERQRVRNDDSVVVEVLYGDVAILLAGDIGTVVEDTLIPLLTPARVRVLKVAHHGSRTSSSPDLLNSWRPQIALVSTGRGNTFGHPAPEVLQRLDGIGATVLRTDLHGQLTVETDGKTVTLRTFVATQTTEKSGH